MIIAMTMSIKCMAVQLHDNSYDNVAGDDDDEGTVPDDDKCLAMQLTTYKCQAVQLLDSNNDDDDANYDDKGDDIDDVMQLMTAVKSCVVHN